MVYEQYIVTTLSTSDQTESWMINVTMSPRQYIPLSAHKHHDLRQTMLYIYLSTNIKLMITWPYISRYISTLKVSWCPSTWNTKKQRGPVTYFWVQCRTLSIYISFQPGSDSPQITSSPSLWVRNAASWSSFLVVFLRGTKYGVVHHITILKVSCVGNQHSNV